jgi:WD40 repeat protein
VRLWDVAGGKQVREWQAEPRDESNFVRVVWGPDGKTLATISRGKARLWNAETGQVVASSWLTGIDWLSWSPDGKLLATLSAQGVRLWDADGKRLHATIAAMPNRGYTVISPEGHYRGSPRVERELVYVVQTDQGQETLSPEEFEKKYGWKNDPEQVRWK